MAEYQNARRVGQDRGRKPVNIVALTAKGKLTGRDAIWAAIRQQRSFTCQTLWLALEREQGDNRQSIDSYLTCLRNGGYIEMTEKRPVNQGADKRRQGGAGSFEYVYQLIKDCGIDAPRLRKDGIKVTQGRSRENMWRTMRIISEFDFRDLAIAASTEEVQVKPSDAKTYIQYLYKAGYLVITQKAKRGRNATPARYRLIASRYSGPKPPQIQRVRQVFDPNLNQVVWPVSADEALNSSHPG